MNTKKVILDKIKLSNGIKELISERVFTQKVDIEANIPFIYIEKTWETNKMFDIKIETFKINIICENEFENFVLSSSIKELFESKKSNEIIFSKIEKIQENITTLQRWRKIYESSIFLKTKTI